MERTWPSDTGGSCDIGTLLGHLVVDSVSTVKITSDQERNAHWAWRTRRRR